MSNAADSASAIDRPEYVRTDLSVTTGVVEKPLNLSEKLYESAILRKAIIVIALAIAWEVYGRWLNNSLLFPPFSETFQAFFNGIVRGVLLDRIVSSLSVLMWGYVIGLLLAGALTVIAINSRIGTDILETFTSMFSPLPAIALLPLSLIWFGLGNGSLVFVLVHSVLWAVALNTHSGFLTVSPTVKMVGRNYNLRGLRFVFKILIPAAFPSILTGLKIGWAFAWRTLIAAELVFGVSSGSGGLGWYIFENKNELRIPDVFAGLLTVILIGLIVENFIFVQIERRTIDKWGLHS